MASRVRTRIHRSCCACNPRSEWSASVQNQLKCTQSNADLIQFYEKKLSAYESDYNELAVRLNQYKNTCELQYKLELQLSQRDEEISQLQKALSDLQMTFLDERERVVNLEAENKMLQQNDYELRKKIQLLTNSEAANEPLRAGRTPGKRDKDLHSFEDVRVKYLPTYNKIRLLENQLEEKTKLINDQKEAFLKDRQIQYEEMKAQQKRDAHQIRLLRSRLKQTQDLLQNCTDDYVKLQQHHLSTHKKRFAKIEKDSSHYSYPLQQRENESTENHCKYPEYSHHFQNSYQVKDHSCYKKEEETSSSREKSKQSLVEELSRLKTKCEKIERRRQLEISGFQNDIKYLRNQLTRVENHLFQLFSNATGDRNALSLHEIYQTANRTKSLTDSVQDLKRRISDLEINFAEF